MQDTQSISETQTLSFGSRTIEYSIIYSNRKSLSITVTPEKEVIIKAPLGADPQKIIEKLKKRASWIIKQQNYFGTFSPKSTPRTYVSGETHKYLGKQYRLKVVEAETELVKLLRGHICVFKNKSSAEALLTSWYKSHAKIKITERLHKMFELLQKEGLHFPILEIRLMKKRWGSCNSSGKIILNLDLIKALITCIDYVIIHELCHLKHYNHKKLFYNLLNKYMPDWQKRKNKLEIMLI